MSDPLFVPHITLDGIVTIVSILVGGVALFIKTTGRLEILSTKVDDHGLKIDKLSGIVEVQARHDERLIDLTRRVNMQDLRWEELRHGKGLVVEGSRAD